MLTKKEIRRESKTRLRSILDDQESLSQVACRELYGFLESFDLPKGTSIGLFLSMKGTEIETRPLVDLLQASSRGYRLLAPRVDDETTIRFYAYSEELPHKISKYGIWEPLTPIEEAEVPQIIIVPGLAFDRNRGRVGHGKGFYDRFFERHNATICMKIALAFEVQVFDAVPVDAYDLPMDALVTEKGVTRFF